RAAERPGLDPAGIVASCGGLALLVYGFIAAGQYGWSSVIAIAAMAGGAAILTAFVLWELWLNTHGGQPLVDLGLFRSARFTWGTVLQAFGIFAVFGLLIGTPQFFQAILALSAMGSAVRLLPLMAGLALGARLAGLPAPAANAVRSSVFSGLAVAHQTGSVALLDSVRAAFVHGTDAMLWVCAGIGAAGVVLALAFLPWRAAPDAQAMAATGPGR